jgi:hypothetical protein
MSRNPQTCELSLGEVAEHVNFWLKFFGEILALEREEVWILIVRDKGKRSSS